MRESVILCVCLAAAAPAARSAVRFTPDLAKMDENREAIRQVIANPKASATDRLFARYDDLKWDLYTCEEAELPAKRKAMEKLLTERGDTDKLAYLKLLVEVIRNRPGVLLQPDTDTLWKLADEVTRGDPALRKEYYSYRISVMTRAMAWHGTVDPAMSAEARLKLVEQRAADPAFKTPPDCDADRVSCLADMGRYDEAEKLLVKRAGAPTAKERRDWLSRLAKFYRERAARYYSEPDPATLRKLVAVCDRMIADDADFKPEKGSGYTRQAQLMKGTALCELGEFAAAQEAANGYVAACKDRACDFDGAKLFATVAFATRKWDAVVSALSPFADKLDADWNFKCAQSLFAAGRSKEAVPYLAAAKKKCRNKYKRDGYDYFYRKLTAE